MQFSNIISLAAGLAVTYAFPTFKRGSPEPSVSVTFNGAAGAAYSIIVPLDGCPVPTSMSPLPPPFTSKPPSDILSIDNDLSISTITSSFDVGDYCTLVTVDSPPPVLVEGPTGTWAVGPPQTVKSISCTQGSTPPPTYITIEFDGAAGAGYSLSVPLNGVYTPTSMSLLTLILDKEWNG